MRALVVVSVLALGALARPAAAQSAPHGVLLPTIPTLHADGNLLRLEPGVPFDSWPARGAALLRRGQHDAAAARADSVARRACPTMPNAAVDSTARMPTVPGDTAHQAPMPVARCLAGDA